MSARPLKAVSLENRAPDQARLEADDVRQIRAALKEGRSHRALAEQYGVGRSTIASIGHRRTWAHLAD